MDCVLDKFQFCTKLQIQNNKKRQRYSDILVTNIIFSLQTAFCSTFLIFKTDEMPEEGNVVSSSFWLPEKKNTTVQMFKIKSLVISAYFPFHCSIVQILGSSPLAFILTL